MLKGILIGLLLFQGSTPEPAKDSQGEQQQTLAQSSPTINSDHSAEPSKDEALKTEQLHQNVIIVKVTIFIAIFGGLSFVAALVYAIVSIKQWKVMNEQARVMREGLEETRNLLRQNEWNLKKTTDRGTLRERKCKSNRRL